LFGEERGLADGTFWAVILFNHLITKRSKE